MCLSLVSHLAPDMTDHSDSSSPSDRPCRAGRQGLKVVFILVLVGSMSGCGFLGIGGGDGEDNGETNGNGDEDNPALVSFAGKDVFLSGANVAWNNFARDVGPNPSHPEMSTFAGMFGDVENHEGNTMRLWLHTNGAHTPAWDDSTVIGPGENTIRDLRAILDEAQRNNVGLIVCLWSFDMLRTSYGPGVTNRAHALLTQRDKTESYVHNALVPMVEALSDHPALVAWEIFNEPEGMSHEYGWDDIRHVAMTDIQRFVNLSAGAIHRTDSTALVTNGAWSFSVLTETGLPSAGAKRPEPDALRSDQVRAIQHHLSRGDRLPVSEAEARSYYRGFLAAKQQPQNYYRDDRLIDAGGDEDGTLDVYTVHYYEWAGTEQSPFHHPAEQWGLNKPIVIGEFFLGGSHDGSGDGEPDSVYGVRWQDLYTSLYDHGYAGALGWQWFDWDRQREGLTENWPRALDNMQAMYDQHPDLVEVNIEPES